MCLMIGVAGNEIVRLQLKFYTKISINSFTNSVVMKVSGDQMVIFIMLL